MLENPELQIRFYVPSDRPYIQSLFTQLDTQAFYLPSLPTPYHPNMLEDYLATWHDGKQFMLFTIIHKASHEPIGLINLDNIDLINSRAEIGIGFSRDTHKQKGYGTQAMRLLMQYAHDYLGLHRLYAHVIDGNFASLKLFKKLGFQTEGILRKHVYRNGHYVDMHYFGYLF